MKRFEKMSVRSRLTVIGLVIAVAAAVVAIAGAQDSQPSRPSWPEALRNVLGPPEYQKIDPKKPLDEQKSIVEIGGRRFAIPTIYIQTNLKGQVKQDGLNLLYVLPDFTSRADFKNKEEYKAAFNDRRMAHMLIQPADGKPSIEEIFENRKKYGRRLRFEAEEYGLKKYYALENEDKKILRDDTYIEENESGNPISFLDCSFEGKAKFPGCTHTFINKGILYKAYLNKNEYLADWKSLQNKAIEFIDSHEINKN